MQLNNPTNKSNINNQHQNINHYEEGKLIMEQINVIPFIHAYMAQFIVVAVVYFLVLIAIFCDLWSGIRKAKQRGDFRSSTGLRKTIGKVSNYYNMLFVITIIDILQMLLILLLNTHTTTTLPALPFLTIFGGIFACAIEIKSIFEKNTDKEKARVQETAKMLSEILKNKDNQEMFGAFLAYVQKEKTNEQSNQ